MNEVKTPKKPLIFYYVMVFLLLMMLNFMAIPWMAERQVKEVDYGTFMTITEHKKIAKNTQRCSCETCTYYTYD